jgi:uncharacterized protein YpbB
LDYIIFSNGEEWYKLRSAVRQMMLRKKEVHHYLPLVQEVATDFVKHVIRKRDKNGEIENLFDEVSKWSQECKYFSAYLYNVMTFQDSIENFVVCRHFPLN